MPKYVSWEELDEDTVASDAPPMALPPDSDRVAALMAERAKLEQRLMALLGKAEPSPDQSRDAQRFPMPIHTVESRLEDRRVAREQERAAAAARRALERARIRGKEEREREQTKRDRERSAVAAEAARRADAERRAEQQLELRREQLARESLLRRWTDLRTTALRSRDKTRYTDALVFEQRNEFGRERALLKHFERRASERQLAERLDERVRAREAKLQASKLERLAVARPATQPTRRAPKQFPSRQPQPPARRRRDFDFDV